MYSGVVHTCRCTYSHTLAALTLRLFGQALYSLNACVPADASPEGTSCGFRNPDTYQV